MDWADDITYAVHDVDDFFRAGFVPLHLLARPSADLSELFNRVNRRRTKDEEQPLAEDDLEPAARATIRLFPLSEPFEGTATDHARLSGFVGGLIGSLIGATHISDDGLVVEPAAKLQVALLKELTPQYVIEDLSLETQRHGQRSIVRDLFKIYMGALEARDVWIFPPRSRQEAEELARRGAERNEMAWVVVDAIANMTESQAVRMHRRLTGMDLGPHVDLSLM
jgi:dGTPase